MAAKLKDEGRWSPGPVKVRPETFVDMIRSFENPPKPTAALRELMRGVKVGGSR